MPQGTAIEGIPHFKKGSSREAAKIAAQRNRSWQDGWIARDKRQSLPGNASDASDSQGNLSRPYQTESDPSPTKRVYTDITPRSSGRFAGFTKAKCGPVLATALKIPLARSRRSRRQIKRQTDPKILPCKLFFDLFAKKRDLKGPWRPKKGQGGGLICGCE